jgi:hypothetical protein
MRFRGRQDVRAAEAVQPSASGPAGPEVAATVGRAHAEQDATATDDVAAASFDLTRAEAWSKATCRTAWVSARTVRHRSHADAGGRAALRLESSEE